MAYNPDSSSTTSSSVYGNRVEASHEHGLPRGQWARPKSGAEIPKPQEPKKITEKDLSYLLKDITPQKAKRVARIFKALIAKNSKQISDYNSKDSDLWKNYNARVEEQNKKVAAYNERRAEQIRKNSEKQWSKQINKARRNYKRSKRVNVAGWAPWNPKYGEFRALSESEYSDIGMDYNKVLHPEKKTIHLSDGTTAEVIDSQLGVPLGFSKLFGYGSRSIETFDENGMSSTKYAELAFEDTKNVESWEGDCGHIVGLAYSATAQLLKVTFKSGSVVIYYRVPSTVAAELLHFAKTGQTMRSTVDGTDRHVLGIRFWDLIRIRGSLNGARYRYEYESGFPSGTYIFGVDYEPYAEYSKHKSDMLDIDVPEEYAKIGITREDVLNAIKGGETAPGVFITPSKLKPSKTIFDKDLDNSNERYYRSSNDELLKDYFVNKYNGREADSDWDMKNLSKNIAAEIENIKQKYLSGELKDNDQKAKAIDRLRALGTNIE